MQIEGAFWYRHPDTGDWRLFLSSPAVDDYGARDVYAQVQGAAKRLGASSLTPSNVSVVRSDDLLVELMSKTMSGEGLSRPVQVGSRSSSGVMLGEALVYRLPQRDRGPRTGLDGYSDQVAAARAYFAANELLEPFWEVVYRPTDFQAQRVRAIRDLRERRRQFHVSLRGWDFPHLDARSDRTFNGGIQSVTRGRHHWEAHRFYKSGLFIWRRRFQEETEDGYEGRMMFLGNLYQFTEWLVAASEYGTVLELPTVEIRVRAVGLSGRELRDPRANVTGSFASEESNFEQAEFIDVGQEKSTNQIISRRWASDFFELFGFQASDELLEFWQQDLFPDRGRPS